MNASDDNHFAVILRAIERGLKKNERATRAQFKRIITTHEGVSRDDGEDFIEEIEARVEKTFGRKYSFEEIRNMFIAANTLPVVEVPDELMPKILGNK